MRKTSPRRTIRFPSALSNPEFAEGKEGLVNTSPCLLLLALRSSITTLLGEDGDEGSQFPNDDFFD